MFDGYCVVHAEHCTSDRREWFEQELKRVGINDYTIVAAPKIEDSDSRLVRFKTKRRRKLREKIKAKEKSRASLFDAVNKCIDIAKSKNWKHVVIIEDDIIFRKNFSARWSEVESEVSDYNWDVLFLCRRGAYQIELGAPTRLIQIKSTPRTNCFVVREEYFSVYQDARAIDVGGRRDSRKTFRYLRKNNCRIFSTSQNLSGQKGGFKSSKIGRSHTDSLKDCFGVHEFIRAKS